MHDDTPNFLTTLEQVIASRRDEPVAESYTSSLFAAGTQRIAQKVGEEAIEVALAACNGKSEAITDEAADLLYHLLVLLADRRIELSQVLETLEARHAS